MTHIPASAKTAPKAITRRVVKETSDAALVKKGFESAAFIAAKAIMDPLFHGEDQNYWDQGDALNKLDLSQPVLARLAMEYRRKVATLKLRAKTSLEFPVVATEPGQVARDTSISWGIFAELLTAPHASRAAVYAQRAPTEWTRETLALAARNEAVKCGETRPGRPANGANSSSTCAGMKVGVIKVNGVLDGDVLVLTIAGNWEAKSLCFFKTTEITLRPAV
jgi:hypothetical protein